jgi:hypothetical protein
MALQHQLILHDVLNAFHLQLPAAHGAAQHPLHHYVGALLDMDLQGRRQFLIAPNAFNRFKRTFDGQKNAGLIEFLDPRIPFANKKNFALQRVHPKQVQLILKCPYHEKPLTQQAASK